MLSLDLCTSVDAQEESLARAEGSDMQQGIRGPVIISALRERLDNDEQLTHSVLSVTVHCSAPFLADF